MKSIRLFSMAVVCAAMSLVSCSGKDGANGEQGIPGADGVDGVDGVDGQDKPNVDFYFQEGYKGYSGTQDDNIVSDENFLDGDETTLSVDYTDAYSQYALLRFEDIDIPITSELMEDGAVCSDAFNLNEAILYVFMQSYTSNTNNLSLKVGFYSTDDPIFVEGETSWVKASAEGPWPNQGGESDAWAGPLGNDNYGVSLPSPTINEDNNLVSLSYGWVPILLPRTVVKEWICNPDSNKGLRIRATNGGGAGASQLLNLYSSENVAEDLRPVLVLKTEKVDAQTAKQAVDGGKEQDWESLSYEEQMAPLYKFLENKVD